MGMGFRDLPPQPPFAGPEAAAANAFVAEVLARGERVAAGGRCVRDVAYGGDYHQRLDLYLPEAATATGLPVVLFMHGGGWGNGYKEWCAFMAPPITRLPAIFVAVGYRLAPAHKYPLPLDDCLAATAWVHRHVVEHGGDPGRMFIGGHSAGGHLAALVTLRRDLVAARGLPADVIKGCLAVSAIFTVAPDKEKFLQRPDDAVAASPLSHVAGNTTPFFVTYGSRDLLGILVMQPPMIAALERAAGEVIVDVIDGADHFGANLDQACDGNAFATAIAGWAERLA